MRSPFFWRTAFMIAIAALEAPAQFTGPLTPMPYPLAFTHAPDYDSTFFITPNGGPNFAAPMLAKFLSAGDAAYMGGGRYAKAGIVTGLYYTRFTEGVGNDWKFFINRGPDAFTLPLPPDVTNLKQLPLIVRHGPDLVQGTEDDLPIYTGPGTGWATIGKMPAAIAALEWARYYDLPISFQMQATGHQGGAIGCEAFDLDRHIESLGKDHCMWDVSGKCDPNDDDPATFEPADTTGGATYSYATPTMAPDNLAMAVLGHTLPYQAYLKRNLQMGIQQLLAIASDARYAGRIVAVAIDPELHYPGYSQPTYPLPAAGGGTVVRPFLGDYNPVMKRAFQDHLQARYGDATPVTDSNGDGATFWGDFSADYLASGGFGNTHTTPAAWSDIDPPRNYPATLATTRPPYWHEWANFRVQVCDVFIEKSVQWAIEAGLPPTRVFTHQTLSTGSYNSNRANWDNADWLDDWSHVEVSGGMSGSSIYQPFNIVDGQCYYPNFTRRDDAWGSPEFNPFVLGGGAFAQTQPYLGFMQTAVQETWNYGAHVLWPHFWEGVSHPCLDLTSAHWDHDNSNGSLLGWTPVNMQLIPGSQNLKALTASNSYIESPVMSLDAANYQFVCVTMQASSLLPNVAGALRCDFQNNAGSTWYPVSTPDLLRLTGATGDFILDMSAHAQWVGKITGLRLFPNVGLNEHSFTESLSVAQQNVFSTEMQSLLIAKQATPRAAALTPYTLALPIDLGANIAAAVVARRLVVFGTDPISPGDYSDFGTAGNFTQATVTCGSGPPEAAIVEPAATLLGMAKTGRFRKLALPNVADLHLSFAIGIENGYSSTDGVAFRVVLRDKDRAVHELFAKEWRWNQWSQRFYVDLDAWKNQAVDLSFEVRGIAKSQGDQSIWRSPRIEQVVVFNLTTVTSGSGQVTPDPSADYAAGTVVPLTAVASSGWIFTNWTTTGTLAHIASPTSASTTITMNGAHQVTANFSPLTTSPFLTSAVNHDGWILESFEGSGVGGTMNSALADHTAIRAGDDQTDRSYRSVLSFDTQAIPDGATIVSATIKLVRGDQRGAPFATLGQLRIGAVPGFFGSSANLELADFRNVPAGLVSPAAYLSNPLVNGGVSIGSFLASGLAAVNKTGLTQLRLDFTVSDDDDSVIDSVSFYPGNAATPANQPVLEVVWY